MTLTHVLEDEDEKLKALLLGPLSPDDSELVLVLREKYLAPPSTKPYNLSTDSLYQRLKTHGSWGDIYSQTKNLFGDQRGGFFVEAGALDGERLSNTLWLEQELGWTGLLIEPNPANYKNLVSKNRKAWASHTCISSHPYPKEEVFVSLSRMVREESEVLRNMNDPHGSSHVLGVTLDSRIYDSVLHQSDKSYSVVQCFPLVSYLLALNISTVDLLSLDVQGVEKDILKNVPWTRLIIRVMVVEVVHQQSFDEAFVESMRSKNFTLVYFRGEDYVFVRNGDPLMRKIRGVTLVMDTTKVTKRGIDTITKGTTRSLPQGESRNHR